MVTIRLARAGAKKRPFYHIVATDSRHPRDGRHIERLGYYNPIATGNERRLSLERERVDYWLSQGGPDFQPRRQVAQGASRGPSQSRLIFCALPRHRLTPSRRQGPQSRTNGSSLASWGGCMG